MKSQPGPPMTLGSAPAARVRQPAGGRGGEWDQAAGRVSLPRRIMSRKARERINAQPL